MKTLVLDSQPLVAYFEKDDGWEAVAEVLRLAADEKCRLLLTTVNWGEVFYVTLREYGEEHAERVLQALKNMPIDLVEVNKELALSAARIKAKRGLSYADCFAAGLAKMKKAEVVTGDKEFRIVESDVKIRWIK